MISPGDLLYDRDTGRLGWVVRHTSTSTITNENIYLIEWANQGLSSYYEWAIERFKEGMVHYASRNR